MWQTFAILSDIHSNFPALEACLERLHSWQERWETHIPTFIAGDVFNAGPSPRETYDLLVSRKDVLIKGNHETYLEEYIANPRSEKFEDTLWRFPPWIVRKLGPELLTNFMERMSLSQCALGGFLHIFHASPESLSHAPAFFPEQSRRDAVIPPQEIHETVRLFCVGHTHYSSTIRHPTTGDLWINIGSVGYPFLKKDTDEQNVPYATFVLGRKELDSQRVELVFEAVPYSPEVLLRHYLLSGAFWECAPFSVAILCQSLFNEDITWPAFRLAKKRGLKQGALADFLMRYMKDQGLLDRLARVCDQCGESATAHELRRLCVTQYF